MPRQGPRRLPAGERDRRLAEEVLYLHSLWRRGGPAPAPIRPRSDRREEHKRYKIDHAAAEPVLAPLPPASSRETLAEAAGASAPSTTNPPPPATPPGPLAQREAVPSWLEFADYDDDGPDLERDKEEEAEAARYFTGLFQRNARLRGHYTRRWRKGPFQCMVCAAGGRVGKAARHFQGCLALVQHARHGRYRRHGAHRALAAVVCRLLGWDIEALFRRRIVNDPRATAGVQHAKENDVAGENNGFSTDDDSYSIDEDEESDDEESVDEEDIETGILDPATDDDEEDSEIENAEEYAEKEDHENRTEDSSTDGDEDANELEISKEAAQKEAANSITRKRDMKIRDPLLSLTHAKLVGTLPKETDIRKRSHVKEVLTPGGKIYEGIDKAKRKASALSYQGQSSTSGVVKKVKVNQQLSNKGKQSNKANETGALSYQGQSSTSGVVKKVKVNQLLSNKGKQSNKTNETGACARKAKRPTVAARKAKQLAKKQLAKKQLAKAARKAKQQAKKQLAKKRKVGCLNS